ncbi:MAG TPA: hypothetical protein VFC46_07595, partial [Humisphaera sp.]|nr:hypothetical protein [Humisphaera sp.]
CWKSATAIGASLGNVALPAVDVAGDQLKAKAPVIIANNGSELSGVYTINIFANTENSLDGNEVLVTTIDKSLTLKTGKQTTVTPRLSSLPSDLSAGNYYIIAEVIEPTGQISVVASSQAVAVQAPFLGLTISAAPVRPATLASGKSGAITVTVANNGNIAASGPLSLTLSQSSDGTTPRVTLNTLVRKTRIARHRHRSFVLHFKTASLAAGLYTCYLSASIGKNVATAVGPTFTVT